MKKGKKTFITCRMALQSKLQLLHLAMGITDRAYDAI